MAEAVVSPLLKELLKELAAVASDQFWRVLGVRSDLRKLRSELSAIQDVIQDAEERSVKERNVRNWVAKLKDAAYDVDDLLDEFQTMDAQWRQQDTTISNKVSVFFSPSNPLAFRIKMSSKIKAMVEKLDEIAQERSRYNFQPRVDPPSNALQNQADTRTTFAVVDETSIYGRDDDVDEILKLLLEKETEEHLSVVTIVGMGGLGKTTLAQLVYKHERVVKQESFDKRIWVYVSEKFHIKRIATAIIESVTGNKCDLSELDPIINRVQQILAGKKFLLILDDVWNENQEEWEKVKAFLVVGAKGSKIVVTTRSGNIASMMGTTSPYCLGVLSDAAAWKLFEKRAFGSEDIQRYSHLEAIGREIVAKCGGSPLAAKALGSIMERKRERRQWLEVRDSDVWTSTEEGNQVTASLKLSYNHLSPDLKQCFAYSCIFPKGSYIEMDTLVSHWIALGFIPFNTSLKSAINKGREIFNSLVWISFLDKDSVFSESYKMHDLVYDLAKSVAGDEYFICHEDADQKVTIPQKCRFCSLVCTLQESELKDLVRESRKIRALKLEDPNINNTILLTRLPRLRVLDIAGSPIIEVHASIARLQILRYFKLNHHISQLPNSIGDLPNLLVLNASFCHQLRSVPESIGKLANLRTLKLSGCGALNSLPHSLGNLSNLEELDLQRCECIVELPESIGKLANLRTLDLSACGALHSLPQPLGSLSNLEELDLHWCRRIVELPESIGKLANLRTLKLSGCGALNSLPHSLGNLSNLEELDLQRCPGIVELPESIGKLANLMTLNLSSCGALNSLPHSLGNLSNLEELDLRWCECIVELPESIGKLANLRTLNLSSCRALNSLPQSLGNLSNLEELDLHWCPGIVELPESIGKLANLRTLSLSDCGALNSLPHSLGNLSNLEELDLHWCRRIVELPESIGKLANLRILRLSYCKALHSLPESLNNLSNLQELDLYNCSQIAELPEGMGNMTNLRHLRNNGMESLRGMPLGIGKMRSLLTLQLFVVGEGINHSSIVEMQHLNLIEGELTLSHLENVKSPGDAARANMKERHRLRSLCLAWSDSISYDPDSLIHEEVLAGLIPHPNLEELMIKRYPGINFPNWVRMMRVSVPNLVELNLYGLKCLPSFIAGLPPCLKKLEIEGIDAQTNLELSGGGSFPLLQLKELSLRGMPNLEEWFTVDLQGVSCGALEELKISHSDEMVDLPEAIRRLTSLRSLRIQYCHNLARLPEWLRELTSLEKLEIWGCSSSLEERCKEGTGEDWPITANIPKVCINGSFIRWSADSAH